MGGAGRSAASCRTTGSTSTPSQRRPANHGTAVAASPPPFVFGRNPREPLDSPHRRRVTPASRPAPEARRNGTGRASDSENRGDRCAGPCAAAGDAGGAGQHRREAGQRGAVGRAWTQSSELGEPGLDRPWSHPAVGSRESRGTTRSIPQTSEGMGYRTAKLCSPCWVKAGRAATGRDRGVACLSSR